MSEIGKNPVAPGTTHERSDFRESAGVRRLGERTLNRSAVEKSAISTSGRTRPLTRSDDLGLPTAPDADVIIGLIHLTGQRNNFTDPTITFIRQLLNLASVADGRCPENPLTFSVHLP